MLVKTGCSRKNRMPELPGIVLVVEGTSDVRVVRGFAERALLEKSADFDSSLLTWRGLDDGTDFVQWSGVLRVIKDRRIERRYGHFPGKISDDSGLVYARQARNALTLCHEAGMPLAVILVCDADSQPERLEGLKQAREDHQSFYEPDYPVVVGMANPCREAWVLCGFEAKDHEKQKLLAKTKELTFDPTREAHKLNTSNSVRNAKQVLEFLIENEVDREEPCWNETIYAHFFKHGDQCGLKAYLEEVQEHLSPLIGI
jgi:hypothetical protein